MSSRASLPLFRLLLQLPSVSSVFDRMGIDYHRGGKRTLGEACRRRGLDVGDVLRQIDAAAEGLLPRAMSDVAAHTSLAALIDHVVATHHDYLRRELPAVQSLLGRTAQSHGFAHGELHEAVRVFDALASELTSQIGREEQVLFPAIRRLEEGERDGDARSLDDAIWVIETEHRRAGEAMSRLRWLTGGYVTPRDGCPRYAQLMSRLAGIEADLHLHIHKEDNVLFPRARDLAERCGEAARSTAMPPA